ncbi:MAG: aminotransferase class I/II-fold pyridoxal phosphate-dependent enzyme [Bacteroidales bacterium]|nr:aminotransferase class I/II-fold pyridoxal phosphate-dependent enzyme [Bacteroidales bacterium]
MTDKELKTEKSDKRIYLSSPHMSGGEIKYIEEAFEQNWIAPLGPNVDEFEKTVAAYCGVKDAAALSSGTAAIHLALIILGVKPGDEVIASSFTFSGTVNPVAYLGATPVFVDSEEETWNMDPNLLEKAIKERIRKGKQVKAIIPVHLYGMPAKMEEILSIAGKYDIPVVEDAAEALGSRFLEKPAGSFGRIAVLSFNGNKILSTSGGGMLLSDEREITERARFLATQARDRASWYQHSQIGYNYRMSNILAGVGRGQMEVIDERVRQRRENHFYYREQLEQVDGITFLKEPNDAYFSNHWLTTILIDPEKTGTSNRLLMEEMERHNIEARYLWNPMHLQPVFSHSPAYLNGTSERLFQQGLCLPSGSNMTDSDRARVMDVLQRTLNKR